MYKFAPAFASRTFAGVLFKYGYTSTPTCTPARAAILTGQKPWNHGMLGAGSIAKTYPFEVFRVYYAKWIICNTEIKSHAPTVYFHVLSVWT